MKYRYCHCTSLLFSCGGQCSNKEGRNTKNGIHKDTATIPRDWMWWLIHIRTGFPWWKVQTLSYVAAESNQWLTKFILAAT